MRIVMGTCCVSPTVAKPFQTPTIGAAEEDWARRAEGATAAGRTPTDNARKLAKSFMVGLHSIVLETDVTVSGSTTALLGLRDETHNCEAS
jgi:hypothetical protein